MVSLRTPWRLGSALNDGSDEDGEIGNVMRQFGALGPDQQRANEHRMPGKLVIDPRLDPVLRVGAAVEVLSDTASCLWRAQ